MFGPKILYLPLFESISCIPHHYSVKPLSIYAGGRNDT